MADAGLRLEEKMELPSLGMSVIADVDVVDDERMARRPAVRVPAAQHVFDAGSEHRITCGALVHGDDARQRIAP